MLDWESTCSYTWFGGDIICIDLEEKVFTLSSENKNNGGNASLRCGIRRVHAVPPVHHRTPSLEVAMEITNYVR